MDERLDYSSEEQMRKVSSAWGIGRNAGSVESLSKDPSKLYLQYKNFHLHLVQKMEYPSMRRVIPSKKAERYSYYRSYTTSPNKCQIFCVSLSNFNIMFWTYIFNAFFKILPHTYSNLFLAAYSPEEHLFLPKMVPFFYGVKFACLVTAACEILVCMQQLIFLSGYLVHGIANKNPWNRCDMKVFQEQNLTVSCLVLSEFSAKLNATNWTISQSFFTSETGDKFQLAQISYFRNFVVYFMTGPMAVLFFMMVWSTIVFLHNYIFTRRFWEIQHRLQLTVIVIEVMIFLNLIHSYFYETDVPERRSPKVIELSDVLAKADIEFFAESISAPPVLHVLTARSTQDILPSHDSFLICFSNTASYLFRTILANRLRVHCKNIVGSYLQLTALNPYSWFYFWPLYFSKFYWGDIMSLGFLTMNLLQDLFTLIITYHCLLEVVTCEWTFVKEWMFNSIASVTLLGIFTLTALDERVYMHLYLKAIVTFTEIFVMYGLYPVGRLIDDVIFHYGAPPTRLRTVVWRLMPAFYFIKVYIMITNLAIVRNLDHYLQPVEWCIVMTPYVAGMIIMMYKYMGRDKRSWQRMFAPDSDWGPLDHQIRQLRKEFNSRSFIGSQSRRQLSRYMIEKREPKAFQLNLNYDPNRRSTMATNMYRLEADKKDT